MGSPRHHTLSGKIVADAMRRGINRLGVDSTISSAISILIKYKIGGLLVTDGDRNPVGVVSKTNLIGAYYAALPLDSPLEHVMTSPPLFCGSREPLEQALEQMKEHRIYRIYVHDSGSGSVVGALAYPDIVGMLYEFCSRCPKSIFRKGAGSENIERARVADCMTKEIKYVSSNSMMHQALEELSRHHIGAILVRDESGRGVGVISKTDLILAYNHGVPLDTPATEVMSAPVRSCSKGDMLEEAIRLMIFSDVHRLFVEDSDAGQIIGVFSLTDAAMNRSGSCQACVASRIQLASQE